MTAPQLRSSIESQGIEVELKDLGQLHPCGHYLAYLSRGNKSKGYFGATEEGALRRAMEGVERGEI